MAHRILVDENTSLRVAEILRGRGYDATHVGDALDLGATDRQIADYADEHGHVLLTHDDDFLLPEHTERVPVLYYSDGTLDTYQLADRVEQVVQYTREPNDLPPVTNVGAWN